MSNKDSKSSITVKEEEVDLGKLFSLIGDAFSKVASWLGFNYLSFIVIALKKIKKV